MSPKSTTNTIPTIMTQPQILSTPGEKKEVRVRFAPSPTGFMHIGSLRTAYYNWLFAKHHNGKFILRIEDTDRARIVDGALEDIIETLEWAGLEYDEGPVIEFSIFPPKAPARPSGGDPPQADNFQFSNKSQTPNSKPAPSPSAKFILSGAKGLRINSVEGFQTKGDYGPYVQSERLEIYRKYVQDLVKEGKAYYCFCTKERLENLRKEQTVKKLAPRYDGACRNLSSQEVKEKLDKNVSYVVRQKLPQVGETTFFDIVRGKISFRNATLDDHILLKSDGWPTMHLASVVDDHLMKISHIIRGEEWVPSTPRHILLYQAFAWKSPEFAHLPILLNPDKTKLSKRKGDVMVKDYIQKGYLPQALLNFILLLGWNPGTTQEIFILEESIKQFSLNKITKSGAVFNFQKLDWMNGYYIRHTSLDELTGLCIPYLIKAGTIEEFSIFNSPRRIPTSRDLRDRQFSNKSQIINSKQKFIIKKTREEVDFEWLKKIVALEQERMKKLSELPELTKFFFVDVPEYKKDLLRWKKMTNEEIKNSLALTKEKIEKIGETEFNKEAIHANLKEVTQKIGVGETLWPFRVALTGAKASAGPFEIAEVLGKKKVLRRIDFAIKKV